MSNLDVSEYIDLTIYDKTAQEVYQDALSFAQWVMPDWVPGETNTENAIMQAIALMVVESMYTINRLPGAITEVLLKLFGVERSGGAPPQFTATFKMMDSAGYTIPAGFQVLLDLQDGGTPMVFTLQSDVVIVNGDDDGTGLMVGNRNTTDFNSIPPGTILTVVSPAPYLLSVTVATAITDGVDAESDAEYLNRGSIRLSRLNETLVLPRHFEAYALEFDSDIKRVKAIDLYNAPGGTPGSDLGYISVAVYGDNQVVSTAAKASLLAAYKASSLGSLNIQVIDPDKLTGVGLFFAVVHLPGYDAATVERNLRANLSAYLSPLTWPWSKSIYTSNIMQVIENTPGVDRVVSSFYGSLDALTWTQTTFDGGISNWVATTNCTVAYEPTESVDNFGGALKITSTANGQIKASSAAAVGNAYALGGTPAGLPLLFQWSMKVKDGQAPRNAFLQFRNYNVSDTLVETLNSPYVPYSLIGGIPNQWVTVWQGAVVNSTTVKTIIDVVIDGTTTGEVFYVDNMYLGRMFDIGAVGGSMTLPGNAPLTAAGPLLMSVVPSIP